MNKLGIYIFLMSISLTAMQEDQSFSLIDLECKNELAVLEKLPSTQILDGYLIKQHFKKIFKNLNSKLPGACIQELYMTYAPFNSVRNKPCKTPRDEVLAWAYAATLINEPGLIKELDMVYGTIYIKLRDAHHIDDIKPTNKWFVKNFCNMITRIPKQQNNNN